MIFVILQLEPHNAFRVELDPNDTIHAMKVAIERATGIPVDNQRLVFPLAGREAKDTDTIKKSNEVTGRSLSELKITLVKKLSPTHSVRQNAALIPTPSPSPAPAPSPAPFLASQSDQPPQHGQGEKIGWESLDEEVKNYLFFLHEYEVSQKKTSTQNAGAYWDALSPEGQNEIISMNEDSMNEDERLELVRLLIEATNQEPVAQPQAAPLPSKAPTPHVNPPSRSPTPTLSTSTMPSNQPQPRGPGKKIAWDSLKPEVQLHIFLLHEDLSLKHERAKMKYPLQTAEAFWDEMSPNDQNKLINMKEDDINLLSHGYDKNSNQERATPQTEATPQETHRLASGKYRNDLTKEERLPSSTLKAQFDAAKRQLPASSLKSEQPYHPSQSTTVKAALESQFHDRRNLLIHISIGKNIKKKLRAMSADHTPHTRIKGNEPLEKILEYALAKKVWGVGVNSTLDICIELGWLVKDYKGAIKLMDNPPPELSRAYALATQAAIPPSPSVASNRTLFNQPQKQPAHKASLDPLTEPAAVKQFLNLHKSFRTKITKNSTLVAILEHAIHGSTKKEKSPESLKTCIKLGWLDKLGYLEDEAPQVVKDAYGKLKSTFSIGKEDPQPPSKKQ